MAVPICHRLGIYVSPLKNHFTARDLASKFNANSSQSEWLQKEVSMIIPNAKTNDGKEIRVFELAANVVVLFLLNIFEKEGIVNSNENKESNLVIKKTLNRVDRKGQVINKINDVIDLTFIRYKKITIKYNASQELDLTQHIHKLSVEVLNESKFLPTKQALCDIEQVTDDKLNSSSKLLEKLSRIVVNTDPQELLMVCIQLLTKVTSQNILAKPQNLKPALSENPSKNRNLPIPLEKLSQYNSTQTQLLVKLLQNPKFFKDFEDIPSNDFDAIPSTDETTKVEKSNSIESEIGEYTVFVFLQKKGIKLFEIEDIQADFNNIDLKMIDSKSGKIEFQVYQNAVVYDNERDKVGTSKKVDDITVKIEKDFDSKQPYRLFTTLTWIITKKNSNQSIKYIEKIYLDQELPNNTRDVKDIANVKLTAALSVKAHRQSFLEIARGKNDTDKRIVDFATGPLQYVISSVDTLKSGFVAVCSLRNPEHYVTFDLFAKSISNQRKALAYTINDVDQNISIEGFDQIDEADNKALAVIRGSSSTSLISKLQDRISPQVYAEHLIDKIGRDIEQSKDFSVFFADAKDLSKAEQHARYQTKVQRAKVPTLLEKIRLKSAPVGFTEATNQLFKEFDKSIERYNNLKEIYNSLDKDYGSNDKKVIQALEKRNKALIALKSVYLQIEENLDIANTAKEILWERGGLNEQITNEIKHLEVLHSYLLIDSKEFFKQDSLEHRIKDILWEAKALQKNELNPENDHQNKYEALEAKTKEKRVIYDHVIGIHR